MRFRLVTAVFCLVAALVGAFGMNTARSQTLPADDRALDFYILVSIPNDSQDPVTLECDGSGHATINYHSAEATFALTDAQRAALGAVARRWVANPPAFYTGYPEFTGIKMVTANVRSGTLSAMSLWRGIPLATDLLGLTGELEKVFRAVSAADPRKADFVDACFGVITRKSKMSDLTGDQQRTLLQKAIVIANDDPEKLVPVVGDLIDPRWKQPRMLELFESLVDMDKETLGSAIQAEIDKHREWSPEFRYEMTLLSIEGGNRDAITNVNPMLNALLENVENVDRPELVRQLIERFIKKEDIPTIETASHVRTIAGADVETAWIWLSKNIARLKYDDRAHKYAVTKGN